MLGTSKCVRSAVVAAALWTPLVALVVACGSDGTAPRSVASVDVSPGHVEIDEGQTIQLTATVRGSDGALLSDRTSSWTSSDTTIASVTAAGLLRGLRDGVATLTVSCEGKVASVPIDVTGRAATIVLSSTRTSLNEGETADLSAVVTSQMGTVLTRHALAWSSNDPRIASIAAVSPIAARTTGTGHGATLIEAFLDGVRASIALSVRGKVARIELSPSQLDLVAGQAATTTVRTWSSNNVLLTDRVITTTNNAPNVAAFDSAWTARALLPGTSLVTVRSEEASANLTIVVHRILLGEIGWAHTCAIVEGLDTYCWGSNGSGELGIGSLVTKYAPERVVTAVQFASLVSLLGGTVGRTAAGSYYRWGGSYSQSSTVPILATEMTGLEGMVAGANFICGRDAGTAYCWGNNQTGQLGTGSFAPILTAAPTVSVAGPPFTALFTSSTAQHTCATDSSGAAWCWGLNVGGMLGDLTVEARAAPVPVTGGFAYTSLTTAGYFTCGQTTGFELRCWGAGDVWMPSPVLSPRLIASGINFVRLTAGIWHACGLTAAGDAYCWGNSPKGALGNGTAIPRSVPTLVAGGRTWVSIAAGGDHTCGVTNTGRMYCWGANDAGELGNGSTQAAFLPVEVIWPVLR